MENVKNFIYTQLAKGNISKENARTMLKDIFDNTTAIKSSESEIAVIGIACRFADAKNPDEYWELLENGSSSINKFPENRRKDTDKFLPIDMLNKEDPYSYAGYLDEIDQFDSAFFRIPPKEAELIDPMQRIFLETAWEAIEDAGLGGKRLSGTKTGVYVGKDTSPKIDYKNIIAGEDTDISTGTTTSILASRLAYILDLKGPSMVVDTACSSSLVSLHVACQALNNGEIDYAIVGGAALQLFPIAGGIISSPNGKISAFDKNADGTVWGEGIGVVILKSLSKAMNDRDNIYAVIKGSAINNDGSSNGLTAPSAESQMEVIQTAWKNAGVNPETITYIEAHGTGTKLGDPIEIKGIASVFSRYTAKKQFCGVGSVKTNIGHTVAASGVASVIKMILSIKNKQIPPSLNFIEPNPYIDFTQSPVYVIDRLTPWKVEAGPRRCGISSFGFSGTNCHVIMEEAPMLEKNARNEKNEMLRHVFTLSAKSEKSLQNLISKYCAFFKKNGDIRLDDICATANKGRGHYNYRLALIVESFQELSDKMHRLHQAEFEIASKDYGIYFGKYNIVIKKEDRKEGELSEEEKIALSLTANKLIKQCDKVDDILEELCNLYVDGADVEWEKVYLPDQYSVISLPVYSFDHKRHWVESENIQMVGTNDVRSNNGVSKKEINHPLLDRCIAKSMNEAIFTTDFSVNTHWVLSEHTIAGKNAIPGTTYLEMAIAAGKEYLKSDIIGLENIQFYTPVVCSIDEIKEVQIVLRVFEEKITYTALSCDNTDESVEKQKWTIHSSGEIKSGRREAIRKYEIENLISKFGDEIEIVREKKSIMGFGPRWRGIRRARLGNKEGLVYLELPDTIKADANDFTLHPSLLDIATSIATSTIPNGDFYLPFGYKDVKIHGSIPCKCYSYISPLMGEGDQDREILKYNVEILDENGVVVVEITDFMLKKVHDIRKRMRELSTSDILYYQMGWEKKEELIGKGINNAGSILVLKDSIGFGENVVQKLKSLGLNVVEAELGQEYRCISEGKYAISGSQIDYDRLFATQKDFSTILHLQSISNSSSLNILDKVKKNEQGYLHSLLFINKALNKSSIKNRINLIMVTKNAYDITGREEYIDSLSTAMIGLAKVIDKENLNISSRCIDLDDMDNIELLIKEISIESSKSTIAYREGIRYIETILKTMPRDNEKNDIQIKADGVYLITGGTGGIGLEVCKYLVSRANVKLALVNRSKLPQSSEWDSIINENKNSNLTDKISKIRELGKEGAEVECFNADISNIEEMKPIIDGLVNKHGRINGVIHTAGVAGDGFLVNKDITIFDKVISPKIMGTIVLDKLTQNYDLDFFILFSSIESLYSSAGQGDYTAANSFLNSYAAYRSKLGKKTVSVMWPAWKEVGMAFDHGMVKNTGLSKALTNIEGINIFEEALSSEQNIVLPIILNYENIDTGMKDQFPTRISDDVWKEIEEKSELFLQNNSDFKSSEQKNSIALTGKDERDFTKIEIKVAEIWAEVLGLKIIHVFESLHNLGGDSLHAIRILKKIEAQFPNIVDISDIFTYSTVFELAAFISKKTDTKEEINIRQDIDEVLRKLINKEIEVDEVDKLLNLGDE